jgi:plastocyanin
VDEEVMHRRTKIAVLVAGVALLGAAPADAGHTRKKTVQIGDNYFLPQKLTVKPKTTIVWKWPGVDASGQVHDVKLRKGPRGVKKFQSDPAATDYTFRRKLTKLGTYRFVCTYHEDMTMTIKVRK